MRSTLSLSRVHRPGTFSEPCITGSTRDRLIADPVVGYPGPQTRVRLRSCIPQRSRLKPSPLIRRLLGKRYLAIWLKPSPPTTTQSSGEIIVRGVVVDADHRALVDELADLGVQSQRRGIPGVYFSTQGLEELRVHRGCERGKNAAAVQTKAP